jgi:hypothetical protein
MTGSRLPRSGRRGDQSEAELPTLDDAEVHPVRDLVDRHSAHAGSGDGAATKTSAGQRHAERDTTANLPPNSRSGVTLGVKHVAGQSPSRPHGLFGDGRSRGVGLLGQPIDRPEGSCAARYSKDDSTGREVERGTSSRPSRNRRPSSLGQLDASAGNSGAAFTTAVPPPAQFSAYPADAQQHRAGGENRRTALRAPCSQLPDG